MNPFSRFKGKEHRIDLTNLAHTRAHCRQYTLRKRTDKRHLSRIDKNEGRFLIFIGFRAFDYAVRVVLLKAEPYVCNHRLSFVLCFCRFVSSIENKNSTSGTHIVIKTVNYSFKGSILYSNKDT
jgi:hypothetical protein